MPGCEEGYTSILPSSSSIAPQLYESTLQKGLATPVNLPSAPATPETEKHTWTSRAEALQLHLEQRLLATPGFAPDDDADDTSSKFAKFSKGGKYNKPKAKPLDNPLLVAGRQAFRSHIRAYATHVKEERDYFDIQQLHLGHMAKAYGLREPPGGIGGGVSRRTHRPKAPAPGGGGEKRMARVSTGGGGGGSGGGGGGARRRDDDGDGVGVVDEDAARRMRDKMRMVMNASSEFNIG
jgi:ATP-dependent RNA helicase DDX31/DBP7